MSCQKDRSLKWRTGLSLVTIAYVFCSFFWLGRQTTVFTEEPLKPIRQFWFFCGFDQDWRLFAPEVRSFNCFPAAIITVNGAKLIWEAPHSGIELQGNLCRLNLHRKFSVDYLPWMVYSGYWQRFAAALAKEWASADKHPQSVSLILNFEQMDSPEKMLRARSQVPIYFQNSFYFERYAKEELMP